MKDFTGSITILWHHDYWDGPKTGVAVLNGELVWFQDRKDIWDSEEQDWAVSKWNVYQMTPEQLSEVFRRKHLFMKHVGPHTVNQFRGDREKYPLKPRHEWAKFYDLNLGKAPEPEGEPIGYFYK